MSRGYIPRGNPRRGRKGGDARIRFNKCHRPQVGDVLAPQSRLRGVRFPRDLDSSLLFRALLSCLLNQRIRFVRYTRTVRRADTSRVCPLVSRFVRLHDEIRIESNGIGSSRYVALRHVAAVADGARVQRGHENFVFGDLNAWTCTRYKCRVKLFESATTTISLVRPVEPSCRSMRLFTL